MMDGIKDSLLKLLRIDKLVDNLSGYVETRVQLLKIEIKEDVAKILSKGIIHGTIILFAFLFLIFFSFGTAEYLNIYFANTFEGYLIVASFYLVCFIVFMVFRKVFDKKFEKYFSEVIKKKED